MIGHPNDHALFRHLMARSDRSEELADRVRRTRRAKWRGALLCRADVLRKEAMDFFRDCCRRSTGRE